MNKSLLFVLVLLAIGGAWYVSQNYDLEEIRQLRLVPLAAKQTDGIPAADPGDSIRIATFNIQMLGRAKLAKPQVVERLADILSRFDIVAIQEIRSRHPDVIPRLVDFINAKGRHYEYVIGPRVGRTHQKEQYAFIFNAETIEVDRLAVETVNDPSDLLHRPPLVAPFRVRGVPPDEAFTFTLVNLHVDPDEVAAEIRWLPDLYRAVQNDGRGEDDIILLGDFNANDGQLTAALRSLPGAILALEGTPTNVRMTAQYDNFVMTLPATQEFTGQAGVLDILRTYNLTLKEALEISDHNPVWATFRVRETEVNFP